jgi:hypothetical protein
MFFYSAPKNETATETNATAKARTTPRFYPSEFTFPPGKERSIDLKSQTCAAAHPSNITFSACIFGRMCNFNA